jgi:hypothetical protein
VAELGRKLALSGRNLGQRTTKWLNLVGQPDLSGRNLGQSATKWLNLVGQVASVSLSGPLLFQNGVSEDKHL